MPEANDDPPPRKHRITGPPSNFNRNNILAIGSITMATAFNYGFQVSLLNICRNYINKWIAINLLGRYDAIPTVTRIIWGFTFLHMMYAFGALLGTFLTIPMMRIEGPKRALEKVTYANIIAMFAMGISVKFGTYIAFGVMRIFVGMCGGMGTIFAMTYLLEISPPNRRGAIGACYTFTMALGFSSAAFFTFVDQKPGTHYLYMFGIAFGPLLISAILLRFVPESPIYTYSLKHDVDAVEEDIAYFRRSWKVQDEVTRIAQEFDLEEQLSEKGLSRILKTPHIKSQVIVCFVLAMNVHFSGSNIGLFFIVQTLHRYCYSNSSIRIISFSAYLGVLVMSMITVLLIDTVGRRFMMIFSCVGCAICDLCLLIGYSYYKAEIEEYDFLKLVFGIINMIMYAGGLVQGALIHGVEAFPYKYRHTIIPLTLGFQWFWELVFFVTYNFAKAELKDYRFAMFVISNVLCIIFTYFYMAECKKLRHSVMVDIHYLRNEVKR